jgi:hypothetical protein
MTVVTAILFCYAVGWDGEYATFLGSRELNIGSSTNRETSVSQQLASYLSHAWLFSLVAYALPVVLVPLTCSFDLTQVCWLRGLHCTPREVAASRAARLIFAVSWTSLLAMLWIAIMVVRHDVQPAKLLIVTLGWASHLLLSGGCVLALGPTLNGVAQRFTFTFLALLLPIVCWLTTFLFANNLTGFSWASWLPYACPYTENFEHVIRHNSAAAASGLALMAFSIGRARGQVIDRVSVVTLPGGSR